jgi:hypothetical protein
MDSCSATDWITAIATGVTATAAVAAAAIAYRAANTWREGLENQRYDECLAAALKVQSCVYACKAAIDNRRHMELSSEWVDWVEKSIWTTYTAAWDRQSQFRAAFSVARRYQPNKFPTKLIEEVDQILRDLKAQAKSNVPDERSLDRLMSDLNKIVAEVRTAVAEVGRR